jgi:hypothetical protein
MYLCLTWGGLVGLVWMSHWHHSLYSIVLCMDFFESSHVSAYTESFHGIVLMYNHINSVTMTLPSPLSRSASTCMLTDRIVGCFRRENDLQMFLFFSKPILRVSHLRASYR